MKILIIEDNKHIRESLSTLLEIEGFQVLSSENGLNGIEQAVKHLPDLVISDINLPKLNGHEVLFLLRRNMFTINIPFIFLTANCDPDVRDLSLKMGANGYVIKPLGIRSLLEMISFVLKIPVNYQKFSLEH